MLYFTIYNNLHYLKLRFTVYSLQFSTHNLQFTIYILPFFAYLFMLILDYHLSIILVITAVFFCLVSFYHYQLL